MHYGSVEATLDRIQGSNLWLTFAIREGKNREVRNVLGHLGLTVARLIRVSFGPFALGELAEGAVEEVADAGVARAAWRAPCRAFGRRLFGAAFAAPERGQREQEQTRPQRQRLGRGVAIAFLARARRGPPGKKA